MYIYIYVYTLYYDLVRIEGNKEQQSSPMFFSSSFLSSWMCEQSLSCPLVKKLDAQKLVGANPGWLKLISLKPVQMEFTDIWMYLGVLSAP